MISYFAYGSNMSSARMNERCPGSSFIDIAVIADHTFLINTRGVATLAPAPGEVAHGVLWKITAEHERTLDQVEGVVEGRYTRESVTVAASDGGDCEALIYLDPIHDAGVPRDGYLAHVLTGAEEHGLPESYIQALRQWSIV